MIDMPDSQKILNDTLMLVAEKMDVEVESLSPETDLYAMGLDSITLMGLVAHWRARGYDVDFATLSRHPSAKSWVQYMRKVPSTESAPSNPATTMKNTKPIEKAFSLAPMQHAYWVGRSPEQLLGGVSAHLYTEFQFPKKDHETSGYLDPTRLSQALERLTERHSSLRLKVTPDGKQIHRINAPAASLQVNDLREETQTVTEQQLNQYRQAFSSQILDIEAGEVIAIAVSQLPSGGSRLHLDIDMMAADAVSYRTLLRELALLYENPDVLLPDLPMSYGDCRRASEASWPDVEKNSGEWWKNRLEHMPEGPKLPLKAFMGSQPKTTRRHFYFDSALRDRLYNQCREHRLTPSSVLATILAETLAGWSKEPRFLINVPLFLRPMEGADLSGIVGDFSSSVLLDVDLSLVETFTERAKHIQSRLHADASHADYNGVQVLRDLGRLKGHQVTAPIVFTSALNLGELFEPVVRRVFGDPIWILSQGPQVLLDTQVTEIDGGILLNWDCREDAFVEGVLDAMFQFFHSSVLALANKPETWTQCLADHLPSERAQYHFSNEEIRTDQHRAAPPSTAIEKAVASVWVEALGDDSNDVNLNLFAAGGDSVLATALVAKLREIFGVDAIDLKALFNAPSIAGLANSLVTSSGFDPTNQIATIYCEIIALDDDAIKAELEEVEL